MIKSHPDVIPNYTRKVGEYKSRIDYIHHQNLSFFSKGITTIKIAVSSRNEKRITKKISINLFITTIIVV